MPSKKAGPISGRSRRILPVRSSAAKQTVRIAIIGAGRMANSVHYPSLASFEDVQIAATI